MFALALYVAFIGGASAYALLNWQRAWLLVMVCGVIQDPVRKLTPGNPVWVSFLVVILYMAILIGARRSLEAHVFEFARRFPNLFIGVQVFLTILALAAITGVVTYGLDKWKVPLLSLITYLVPLVAMLLGYAWLQREEMFHTYLRFYAAVTSIALIGSFLEYMRVKSGIIGMVAFEGDYIRHLPGIQIRMLSGFYRSPDIMAAHAALLTAIGVAYALRAGVRKQMLVWSAVAGWGFFICMIAGRRKAIYFTAIFVLLFVWRYFRRLTTGQMFALLAVILLMAGVVRNLANREETSIYARGAATTQSELADRLEGGAWETFEQFGFMGAGLGAATQGVYHLLGTQQVGWQEGGLGKLAVEVGLPGILALTVIGWIVMRLLLRLTSIDDVPGSSRFLRVLAFALVGANGAAFMASAQAYTDAVLGLTAGFMVGCLFASAALDERLTAGVQPAPQQQPATAPQTQTA